MTKSRYVSGFMAIVLMTTTVLPAFGRKDRIVKPRSKPVAARPLSAVKPMLPGIATKGRTATFGENRPIVVPVAGSLLNPLGELVYPITEELAQSYQKGMDDASKLRRCELLLARDCQPVLAEEALAQIIRAEKIASPLRALAKRAKAFALFFQGRYREAEDYLEALCDSGEIGIDRKSLQAFRLHAEVCASYHEAHERAGIFQPGKVDPLCGVRAVAKSAERWGVPYNEKTTALYVRHDGFGSSNHDIVKGIQAMGLEALTFKGDFELVKYLPKPLIAHVERDHFITVLETDEQKVTYWCVDCNGKRNVTWKQWKLMEPGGLITVHQQDSEELRQLRAAFSPALAWVAAIHPEVNPFAEAADHGRIDTLGFLRLLCGAHPQSLQCEDCPVRDRPCKKEVVSLATGDPINIATGGEEYHAQPDLEVYNPIGPSVTWQREYYSLGNPVDNGFGTNWSHNYNLVINTWSGTSTPGPDPDGIDIVVPSSGHIRFRLPEDAHRPSSTNTSTVTLVPDEVGSQCVLRWAWNGTNDYFILILKNGTRIYSTPEEAYPKENQPTIAYLNPGRLYRIGSIEDILGRAIKFEYEVKNHSVAISGQSATTFELTNLISINDEEDEPLLTLATSSNGDYVSATDRYGRIVDYTVSSFTSQNMPSGVVNQVYGLTAASQVRTSGSPVSRDEYAYSQTGNGENSETVASITQFKKRSPTGSGLTTTFLEYDSEGRIFRGTDHNGNQVYIDQLTGVNRAEVTRLDGNDEVVERYYVGWNIDMVVTDLANENDDEVVSLTYAAGSDDNHFRPTTITDAYNHTWTFT